MRSPIVAEIDTASKQSWPIVQEALARTMRSVGELAAISEQVMPKVEDYVTRGGNAAVRRRKICEETIWALANLGWLRTGGERDVILAAKAWADLDPDFDDNAELNRTDEALATAVLALPEYMTIPTAQEASA